MEHIIQLIYVGEISVDGRVKYVCFCSTNHTI
jgi:hypothetical protein